MKKRLLAMSAAAIVGGGLATAVSGTPAMAAGDHFIVNWASVRAHGSDLISCARGQNVSYVNDFAARYVNNCAVRVWVYDPSGFGQCVSPKTSTDAQFAEIGRIFVSSNLTNC